MSRKTTHISPNRMQNPPQVPNGIEEPPLRIAAIVPLFNGELFIRQALESILLQTVPVDEIIVVDDGSTDNGASLVEVLMRENPVAPIRLLRKENGGQSSARNLGINSTTCELIALLDQDDSWYANHIQVLMEPFARNGAGEIGLVYGDLDHVDAAGRLVTRNSLSISPSTHPKTSRKQCLSEDMYILPGASLFRKSAFEAAGGFDERLSGYEDDDLFLRMFTRGYRLVFLNQAVTQWRIHASSTSYSPRMARSRQTYFFKLVEMFPDEPRVGWNWTTEVIAPRFFRQSVDHFLHSIRYNDRAQADYAMESASQILRYLPRSYKRPFRIMLPAVQFLRWLSLDGVVIWWIERKMRS